MIHAWLKTEQLKRKILIEVLRVHRGGVLVLVRYVPKLQRADRTGSEYVHVLRQADSSRLLARLELLCLNLGLLSSFYTFPKFIDDNISLANVDDVDSIISKNIF